MAAAFDGQQIVLGHDGLGPGALVRHIGQGEQGIDGRQPFGEIASLGRGQGSILPKQPKESRGLDGNRRFRFGQSVGMGVQFGG